MRRLVPGTIAALSATSSATMASTRCAWANAAPATLAASNAAVIHRNARKETSSWGIRPVIVRSVTDNHPFSPTRAKPGNEPQLDPRVLCSYHHAMDEEIDTLAQRVDRLVALSRRLADENQRLRTLVEESRAAEQALRERMDEARARVEAALSRLPVAPDAAE